MSFGEKLRDLIDERDERQKDVAARLHLGPSTLSSYIQNVREPDFATLCALADYFGVSTDYLLSHKTAAAPGGKEADLLRIYRALSPEQQEILLTQARAILHLNAHKKGGSSTSTSAALEQAG